MKVYVIIHDGTNLLVGTGGNSFSEPTGRSGYHLPGGRKNSGETNMQTATRETKEETGIDLDPSDFNGSEITPTNTGGADFLIAKVSDVKALVSNFRRPKIKNANDEPFAGLLAIPLHDCWSLIELNINGKTDYFGKGLQAAHNAGLI